MKIKEGFVLRKVAGQTVAVATGEAAKDFRGMVKLNATGSDIWQGLMNGLDEEAIVDRLTEKYEVPREQAAADTRNLLKQMEEAGFLEES